VELAEPDPAGNSRPEALRHAWAHLATILAVFSGTSFVVATVLLVDCTPIVVDGTSTGCPAPNGVEGWVVLVLGVVLLFACLTAYAGAWQGLPMIGGEPTADPPAPPRDLTPRPMPVRSKCQYCGAWSEAGATYCRRCERPLSWSNPA